MDFDILEKITDECIENLYADIYDGGQGILISDYFISCPNGHYVQYWSHTWNDARYHIFFGSWSDYCHEVNNYHDYRICYQYGWYNQYFYWNDTYGGNYHHNILRCR